jgi:hypothetical protein
MIVQPCDYFLIAWFILAGLFAAERNEDYMNNILRNDAMVSAS